MKLKHEKINSFKIKGKDFDKFIADNYKEFGLKGDRFKNIESWFQIAEDGNSRYMSHITVSIWHDYHKSHVDFCKREGLDPTYENMHDPDFPCSINVDVYKLMLYLCYKGHIEEGYYYFSE